MNGPRRCLFCFAETQAFPKLTREHLVSRPVSEAYGIDREAIFARTSASGTKIKFGIVGGQNRKAVCAPCNNGWMNALEGKLANVAPWLSSWNEPLGAERDLAIRSWALKTHLLLCLVEGKADQLGDEDVDDAVIAPFTAAKLLFRGDLDMIRELRVGVARSREPGRFQYAFGSPTMARIGPTYAGNRTAPTSILTVNSLQLWITTPIFDAEVTMPHGVVPSSPNLTMRQTRELPPLGNLDAVIVDYGEHNTDEVRARLDAFVAEQQAEK